MQVEETVSSRFHSNHHRASMFQGENARCLLDCAAGFERWSLRVDVDAKARHDPNIEAFKALYVASERWAMKVSCADGLTMQDPASDLDFDVARA